MRDKDLCCRCKEPLIWNINDEQEIRFCMDCWEYQPTSKEIRNENLKKILDNDIDPSI